MKPHLFAPWLEWDLGAPHRVLSWAVHRPGLVTAWRLLWREVRDDELTPELDAERWLQDELEAIGAGRAVVMLTSRRLSAHVTASAEVEGIRADCLATVGLSNAERAGTRRPLPATDWGTINIGVRLSAGLSTPAMIEAISIAAEARTLAVVEAGLQLPTGTASGTGTDCLALACPLGELPHVGLHTAAGEALGRAVHQAVAQGVAGWRAGPAAHPLAGRMSQPASAG